MQPYHYLSQVYDILQEEIDYSAWYQAFSDWVKRRAYRCQKILEVGAGTGNMTAFFIADQRRVTALEPSEAMLQRLVDKFADKRRLVDYFCGDVSSFQTAQQYDAVVGFMDVLNYLAPTDLTPFFERLASLTRPGGLIYFDLSTIYKLSVVIGNQTFAESLTDFAYIWQNQYDATRRVLDFDLTIFDEVSEHCYRRHVETHRQYGHALADIRAALPLELQIVDVLGDDFKPLQDGAQRMHIFIERQ